MFGITIEDVVMQDKIARSGLTVSQASTLRKEGALPEELAKAWDEYDLWLKKWKAEPGNEA